MMKRPTQTMKVNQLKHEVIGDTEQFAIGYAFLPREPNTSENYPMHQCTEMAMVVAGTNLMGFTRDETACTVRWQLDEAVEFLDEFARNSRDEKFPFADVPGCCLAELEYNARDFDTDDDDEFDRYYDALDEYVWPRSWHHTCGEAVFPFIYFRVVGNDVEISWDNRDAPEGVAFDTVAGHALVPLATFRDVVSRFVAAYLGHWGGYAWDLVER